MKKVVTLFSPSLQTALDRDKKFRELPLLDHALAVANFFVVMAATGRVPQQHFPTLDCDPEPPSRGNFKEVEVKLFSMAYSRANRVEVQIDTGIRETCLSVKIIFYKPGRNEKLLEIDIAVDSQAVRKYDVPPPKDGDLGIQYSRVLYQKVRDRKSTLAVR